MGVEGEPHVARAVDVGLPEVGHQHPGPELLKGHLAPQLPDQRGGVGQHPVHPPVAQRPALLPGEPGGQLEAQAVMLHLLLQMDERQVVVVPADAELLPLLDSVQLFPQDLVAVVVEVNAADCVAAVAAGVGVRAHHRSQPRPEGQIVGIADAVLQLMPIFIA